MRRKALRAQIAEYVLGSRCLLVLARRYTECSAVTASVAAVILLPAWNPRAADRVLERVERAEVTYPQQGETRSDELPHGYQHDRRELHVGQGDAAWERARDAIRRWEAHRFAGFAITPTMARLDPGVTVVASRAIGPMILAIPCRIIYCTDEPNRFGFAYGTLPGHPEQGEEAFHVLRGPEKSVTAQIVAFS